MMRTSDQFCEQQEWEEVMMASTDLGCSSKKADCWVVFNIAGDAFLRVVPHATGKYGGSGLAVNTSFRKPEQDHIGA